MAGDWIKVEHTTPDKPELVRMASALRADQDMVMGKLLRVWIWADANSVNGASIGVTEAFIDRLAVRRGFAAALRSVGWLAGEDGALTFPQFARHNGNSAKARVETNRRVTEHRERNKNVTPPPLQQPLPETEKEEIKTQIGKKVLDGLDKAPEGSADLRVRSGEDSDMQRTGMSAPPSNGHRTEWQRKVDDLRPDSWAVVTTWNTDDLAVYARCERELARLPRQKWLILAWYFRWCCDKWNSEHHPDETRVTGKRGHFLANLGSYLARADKRWKSSGKPALEPKETKAAPQAKPAPPEAPMPPVSFRALVAGVNEKAQRQPPTAASERKANDE